MKANLLTRKFSLLMALGAAATLSVPALAAPKPDAMTLQALIVDSGTDAKTSDAAVWEKAPVTIVALQPAFPGHPSIVGTPVTDKVTAQVVRAGEVIYIRLRWNDKAANTAVDNTNRFVDGVAVQFPVNGNANTTPFMGDAKRPVNVWHWRADGRTENIVAHGFGSATRVPTQALASSSKRLSDGWDVVLERTVSAKADDGVALKGRKTIPIAFAAWDGDNQERDGLKAVTLQWWKLRF
jgi:selenate/chlorate reductase subunit gamma